MDKKYLKNFSPTKEVDRVEKWWYAYKSLLDRRAYDRLNWEYWIVNDYGKRVV
jgi:hypothetical protein